MIRGDLIIVDFRRSAPSAGVRPALVVQNDRDNARMNNTIVVQVTTTIRRAIEDTQLLIDQNHADWKASGLRHPSVINCCNLYVAAKDDIVKTIGHLSAATMKAIDECLKTALSLA
jgi:mRNA interferase MazF